MTDDLLDALAEVESGNDPQARGDASLRFPAFGAFQMRLPAYQDVQRFFPKEFGSVPFEKAMADPATQRQATRRYLEALESRYGLTNLEQLIAGYNAGPGVRRRGITNPGYVEKVKRRLTMPVTRPRSAAPGSHGEQLASRINRMVLAAGMKSLDASEIMPILQQADQPQPMAGYKSRPQRRDDAFFAPGMLDSADYRSGVLTPTDRSEFKFQHPRMRGQKQLQALKALIQGQT